ncbi:DUF998 domain-containing protein [Dictyobacter kobayashii]|uniref:DUF998 domain-containing protein n=1 Tax=Dictyobacter kobayashii TaxID=2014872 RepID=A0A402ASA9_9CHLR|nr:DUF998 domain-containing protein [Dictyobacter kobayashii]GCE21933.1 hypothetical protein KDK_57330 [Dictyobacter kobayashii]
MSSLENSRQHEQATQSYPLITRFLLWAGAVGPVFFVVVLLIEGVTRPGYSAWRTFGSLLSLGDQGWMQITNFIVCGVLALGFGIGLRQVLHSGKGAVWGPILLGLWGLLLIIAGIFVTDPGQGYPVGVTPLASPTEHGIIHALSGLAIFIVLPIAAFVMIRRFASDPTWRGWALYSLLTGVIMIVSFFLSQLPGDYAIAGLLQRIGIIAGWFWVSLFAITLLRRGRAPEVMAHSTSR